MPFTIPYRVDNVDSALDAHAGKTLRMTIGERTFDSYLIRVSELTAHKDAIIAGYVAQEGANAQDIADIIDTILANPPVLTTRRVRGRCYLGTNLPLPIPTIGRQDRMDWWTKLVKSIYAYGFKTEVLSGLNHIPDPITGVLAPFASISKNPTNVLGSNDVTCFHRDTVIAALNEMGVNYRSLGQTTNTGSYTTTGMAKTMANSPVRYMGIINPDNTSPSHSKYMIDCQDNYPFAVLVAPAGTYVGSLVSHDPLGNGGLGAIAVSKPHVKIVYPLSAVGIIVPFAGEMNGCVVEEIVIDDIDPNNIPGTIGTYVNPPTTTGPLSGTQGTAMSCFGYMPWILNVSGDTASTKIGIADCVKPSAIDVNYLPVDRWPGQMDVTTLLGNLANTLTAIGTTFGQSLPDADPYILIAGPNLPDSWNCQIAGVTAATPSLLHLEVDTMTVVLRTTDQAIANVSTQLGLTWPDIPKTLNLTLLKQRQKMPATWEPEHLWMYKVPYAEGIITAENDPLLTQVGNKTLREWSALLRTEGLRVVGQAYEANEGDGSSNIARGGKPSSLGVFTGKIEIGRFSLDAIEGTNDPVRFRGTVDGVPRLLNISEVGWLVRSQSPEVLLLKNVELSTVFAMAGGLFYVPALASAPPARQTFDRLSTLSIDALLHPYLRGVDFSAHRHLLLSDESIRTLMTCKAFEVYSEAIFDFIMQGCYNHVVGAEQVFEVTPVPHVLPEDIDALYNLMGMPMEDEDFRDWVTCHSFIPKTRSPY